MDHRRGIQVVLLAIGALRLEGAGRPHHETRPDGLVSGVTQGLRFVWNLRVLRALALIDLTVTALYLPMESVLFPTYFSDRQQPAQLGSVLVALSLGSLVGALGYGMLSNYVSRRTIMLTAVLTLGAATTGIALLPRYRSSWCCAH